MCVFPHGCGNILNQRREAKINRRICILRRVAILRFAREIFIRAIENTYVVRPRVHVFVRIVAPAGHWVSRPVAANYNAIVTL